MIKKASIAFTLFLANSAVAQWEATVGYSQFDSDWLSLDVGAAILGTGYSFAINDKLTITPIARIGFGVKDDTLPITIGSSENGQPLQYEISAEVEVDQYYGIQVRGEFALNERAYLFVAPSYSAIETEMTVKYRSIGLDFADSRENFDRNGFGIGAGAGFRANDLISAELIYEKTDLGERVDMNTLSAQLRFSF